MEKIVVPKENAFNFLRLICALIVIYEHSVLLSGSKILPCMGLREIAVNVFFILSGFWVTQSYLRSSSVKEYAKKRFRKIFPLYFTVVILSAILLVFFSNLSAKDYFTDSEFYKYLIANLTTLNFIHPTLPGVFEGLALGGSVNGSLWTIKIELGFYIILPLIVYLINKMSKNNGGVSSPSDLIFRRFLPKNTWTKKLDDRYSLIHSGYNKIINPPCLSGCFMFMRVSALKENDIFFDERYFMYLEDFDLMRRLHRIGKTIFYPEVTIIHNHAKESYKSKKMLIVHIKSAIKYFNKFGWFFDKERRQVNKKILKEIKSNQNPPS